MVRLVLALCALLAADAAADSVDFRAWTPSNAIKKVVTLMRDMKEQLEKEQGEDEDVYDKMSCWCETGDKTKTKAISMANQKVDDLTSAIEEMTAKSQQFKVDVGDLTEELAQKQKALAEASALREKESAEFHASETDSIQAIGSVKSAIVTLGAVHNGAALPQEAMVQLRAELKQHLKPAQLRKLGLAPAQQRAVASLLQGGSRQPELMQGEAGEPQSGQIFGLMKGMKESFESNLAKATKDEETAAATYTEMTAAKQHEVKAATEMLGNKQASLAENDDKNSAAKEDLEDTKAQLEADTAYLADLKERCGTMDQDFADRSKMRNEEITAVSEALEIMSSDEARDTLSRSTSLLQLSSAAADARKARAARAAKALSEAAQRLGKPKLSALSVLLSGGVFDKVKESINLMIEKLKKEDKEEVEKKDWCRDELHSNDMQTAAKYAEKDDTQTSIDELTNLVQNGKAEIESAQEEIKTAQVALKAASTSRQAENVQFQASVADQKATQTILGKAKERLQAFYSKAALLQVAQAPPPGFKAYKKAGGAGGVIGMMDQIIADSVAVEKAALHAEQSAQSAYEQFAKDTSTEIASLQQQIVDKTERMASADQELVRANEELQGIVTEVGTLDGLKQHLHSECDYILNDFETRQAGRGQEIEALQQAMSMLNGANA